MSYVDGTAVNISILFSKMQLCHMLTAQPSTYDMFALIELFGRKVESEYAGCPGAFSEALDKILETGRPHHPRICGYVHFFTVPVI